ncbi:gluconate:H+ symporter [Paraburkholderia caballeronis]|uniref:GntT/GntP/DsdX family permease n=1 Tax=Paraburkholderia caballeronis TaxID=416943 RepID=UPI001064FA3A|nr:gluconate:H+ symporter [Paraburkholderia caballeronis]TDV15574.1 GntP family gluconate:H+ symporter [Paraburkholderia caballeronis]TDV17829.1 GntP family gluconate:H+ symporter [Paraburkholderia caballeronis]TDV26557.1 GntP family gluconate:H+ symporter [Paraburkholderia caballeronis]
MHPLAPLTPWSASDTQLILSCLLGLALIVVCIAWLKLAPFLSILGGTFAAGAAAGLPLETVASSFSKGAGALLGDIGIIIALGAMLGALVAESGAADRLVSTILKHSTPRTLPWLMAVVALIIGLPLFFEVGLVMMVPIIFVMARRSGQPILRIAIPALAGMTTLHALLPPHPGPLIAVSALHADLGLTLGFGLIVALPVVVLAGPLYGAWLSKRLTIGEPDEMGRLFSPRADTQDGPGFGVSLLTMLLPVLLMLGRTVARLWLGPHSLLYGTLNFLGEPIIALGLTVLFAIVVLGWSNGMSREQVGSVLRKGLPPIAALLLTIGAGGGLKQTLVAAGISDTISKISEGGHLPLIVLAWLIAVALRQATGSATVATTTTAGIVAPVVAGLSASHTSLLALAIGAGSVFFCHVNDAGFWMIREYFGLKLKETVYVWSILQTIVSVVGLALTFVLWNVFA